MATKKNDDDVKISKKFKRAVTVKITGKQRTEKQDRMVEARLEIEKQKEKIAPYQKRIKSLNDEVLRLANEVEQMNEEREVQCYNEFHFSKNKVIVKTTEGDDVVEERAMTPDERQEVFPNMDDGGDLDTDDEDEVN